MKLSKFERNLQQEVYYNIEYEVNCECDESIITLWQVHGSARAINRSPMTNGLEPLAQTKC